MTCGELISKLHEIDPSGEMQVIISNDPWPSIFVSEEDVRIIQLQQCESNQEYWHVYRGLDGAVVKEFIALS